MLSEAGTLSVVGKGQDGMGYVVTFHCGPQATYLGHGLRERSYEQTVHSIQTYIVHMAQLSQKPSTQYVVTSRTAGCKHSSGAVGSQCLTRCSETPERTETLQAYGILVNCTRS